LISCALLTHITHGVATGQRGSAAEVPPVERDQRGGFTLIVHDRYLLLIALSVLILNFVNTTGDFLLAQLVNDRAHALPVEQRGAFIGSFYGDFQTYISVLTSFVQIVVVARAFKVLGIGGSLLFLPMFAFAGYGLAGLVPMLGLVATVKVVENATDYSLQNTTQQALFLSTSRAAKYKAKAAIDTLFVRLGDLASTGVVFVGAHLSFSTKSYALLNVLVSAAWIWLALRLRKRTSAPASAAPAAETGLSPAAR
jgi:AAA family ATP:ADP antiporter